MSGFDHKAIEKKAQEKWAQMKLFETDLSDASKDPYYLLVEFPYPSGDLHIGHWYAFAVTDIYARILRMQGKNVLFPFGFDAFGLPAENAAIKNGVDPAAWTLANIERMRGQIASMGTSFDWSKEVITCDPSYYQWTQWLFSKLFEHNLAERREARVKWCPKDQTVLANEQVIDGRCERCGTPVEEKILTQWFLKITDYADRLLADLEPLPWREEIKEAQRAWIGKSEGAKINFLLNFKKHLEDNERRGPNGERGQLTIFTTRPDTIFGATYLVLAPEHPWITLAIDDEHDVLNNKEEIRAYVEATKKKTERERSENKEKTGLRLEGVAAINPATKEEIPLYVADYVIGSYGTGAVMAVPAHDERDFEFAQARNAELPPEKEHYFIFDFDGVLGDTFESASRAMIRMGHMADIESAREDVLTYARNKPRHTRDHSLTPEQLKGEYEWTALFGEAMEKEEFGLFDSFIDQIEKIPNVKIAIVSSGSKMYVDPAIKKSRLKPTHVLAFEDHHSKEEKIERIAKDWGVPVKDLVFFTDTKADYLELKEMLDPSKIFGCAWGYLGPDELAEVMPPSQILSTFTDIHRVIDTKLPITQVVAPVSTRTTGGDAVHPDEPFTPRDAVMCIVKHWEKDEYLCLEWKEHPEIRSFVSGGIEEGETPEEAGIREIREESGYLHPRFVRQLGGFSYIEFFHQIKKKNIRPRFRYLYFELADGEREPIAAEEGRNAYAPLEDRGGSTRIYYLDGEGRTLGTDEGRIRSLYG
jgi:8-oxo-dGTP pyrophosphatase MutT (NUDIX family)/phosphoglycolate phosphatase-like HAD superfamily hydrolase